MNLELQLITLHEEIALRYKSIDPLHKHVYVRFGGGGGVWEEMNKIVLKKYRYLLGLKRLVRLTGCRPVTKILMVNR